MPQSIENQIYLGLVDASLESAFSAEWITLSEGRREVIADFIAATNTENISAREYQQRIGDGNLQKYANCLLVSRSIAKA